jgi:sporulation protein YlmC with PRC-barrel domain
MLVKVLVSVDSLSGKNVIGTGGTVIGEVKGAEVNTATWQVTHLRVKLTSAASDTLGFKKRFGSSSICMPIGLISAVGDVVTIASDVNELSQNALISGCPD